MNKKRKKTKSLKRSFDIVLNHYHKGNFKRAEELCKQLVIEYPNDVNILHLQGLIQLELYHDPGSLTKVQHLFEQIIKLSPKQEKIYLSLARVLEYQQQYHAALSQLDKALSISPDDLFILQSKGIIYEKLQHYYDAEIVYKKILQQEPNHDHALNNLACIYAERGDKPQAILQFKRLISLYPNNPTFLNNLASFYIEQGDYRTACNHLAVVVEKHPNHVSAGLNYAYALRNYQQPEHALDIYHKMLKYPFDYSSKNIDKSIINATIVAGIVRCYQMLFDWDNFAKEKNKLQKLLSTIDKTKYAQIMKPHDADNISLPSTLCDDLNKSYAEQLLKKAKFFSVAPIIQHADDSKLNVAYFSSQFKPCGIGEIIVELCLYHDQKKFNIFIISLTPIAQQISANMPSFVQWINLANDSDEAVARKVSELSINILIDLDGYRNANRAAILATQIANVQAHWLNKTVNYHLPTVRYHLTNNGQVDICSIPNTETTVCLPEQVFPLNNNVQHSKDLHPEFVFSGLHPSDYVDENSLLTWIKILQHTSNSKIWLYAKTNFAQEKFLNFFALYGILEQRICFFDPETNPLESLLFQANIHLDTLPQDDLMTIFLALRSRIPILTYHNKLSSIYLKQITAVSLVSKSEEELIQRATQLANNTELYLETDSKIKVSYKKLLDLPEFTLQLEKALQQIWQHFKLNQGDQL